MKKATVIGTVLLGMLLGNQLAGAATETEWDLPFPAPQPLQVASGSSGTYYIDFDGTSGIAYLGRLEPGENPRREKFEEMATPFLASTGNDLQIRPSDGAVFTTDLATRALALANLDTRRLTTWTMPAAADSGPRSIAFDSSGRVLFLSSGPNVDAVIGRLAPSTGLVELWTIPETIVAPGSDIAWRIVTAADGTVFFNVNGFGHPALLAQLNLATGVFTSWVTPQPPIFGLAADGTGAVYFQEQGDTLGVARFVPATGTLTEWTFVDDIELTQNMVLQSGLLFFGNNGPTGIVSLDPSVAGVDSTLSPAVSDPVTPSTTVVRPVVTKRDPRRKDNARGAVTASPPTSAGPFTVFPTDFPDYIAGDGAGSIYFTGGADGASIAKLTF
jgi:streptogramin lyase